MYVPNNFISSMLQQIRVVFRDRLFMQACLKALPGECEQRGAPCKAHLLGTTPAIMALSIVSSCKTQM
jgi:hypothetical protein